VTPRSVSKGINSPSQSPVVLVVDDDPSVREALSRLFRSVGLDPKLFASAAELLERKLPDAPCCLVLDIRLPGQSGLDFQAQLAKADIHVPIGIVKANKYRRFSASNPAECVVNSRAKTVELQSALTREQAV